MEEPTPIDSALPLATWESRWVRLLWRVHQWWWLVRQQVLHMAAKRRLRPTTRGRRQFEGPTLDQTA